jgi:hypothetical protein
MTGHSSISRAWSHSAASEKQPIESVLCLRAEQAERTEQENIYETQQFATNVFN